MSNTTEKQPRKLAEIAQDITVQFTRIGFDPTEEHTSFIATVSAKAGNQQNFEYFCGLFASVSDEDLAKLRAKYHNNNGGYNLQKVLDTIRQGGAKYAKQEQWAKRVWQDISVLCKPSPVDLLESLKLDASAEDYTFEQWAAELGYDEDSRKALAIYEACKLNSAKLRKALGNTLFKELMDCEID